MKRDELLKIAKPVLFNTEMVRAILDGRKTQTRRVVKPRYKDDEVDFQVITNARDGKFSRIVKVDENGSMFDASGNERIVKPPYEVGDILYVREAFGRKFCCECGDVDCNRQSCQEAGYCYRYRADYGGRIAEPWKPSIHMPKEAARIFLRVTDVRAEQLQSILMFDMEKEGVIPDTVTGGTYIQWQRDYFKPIWNRTIKKSERGKYGWDANPWVWVIEFERVEVTK